MADRGLSFFAAPEESEAWLHFCGELGWRVARIERGKLTSIYIGEEDVEDSLLVNAPGRYGYVSSWTYPYVAMVGASKDACTVTGFGTTNPSP